MFGRKNPRASFFDLEIFARMIPKEHLLVLINAKKMAARLAAREVVSLCRA